MGFYSLLCCVSLLLTAAPWLAHSLPSGPPVEHHFEQICGLMTPLHHGIAPIASTGGFFINTDLPRDGYVGFNYTAGDTYTVTLTSKGSTFRGFLVIAHVPGEDQMLLGSFTPQNASQQTLNCSATGASNEIESTIAHNNSALIDFQSVTMKWTAPSDQNGIVDFRFTVVHNFSTFYAYQRASLNGLYKPTRDPEDYRLTFRSPPDCQVSSCDVFVGIDTNEGDAGFLDIYLEGTADGWVAVGFTETANMFSSDVVACNRNGDVVQALDTYNLPNERNNLVDPHQNVAQFSANYSDGRLMCSVAKKIEGDDPPPVDIKLDSKLYILFGRRKAESKLGGLLPHEIFPEISLKKYNPVKDKTKGEADNFPKLPLVRAHGTLMLIAWPLLGVSGIFFASWMRPALPQGQWFHVHRVLMLSSLFIGIIGVAMVFIGHAHEDNPRGLIRLGSGNPVATSHFAIGLFIVLIQIINPILAIFRCKPNDRFRWIFNIVHGLSIGLGAGLLAFVNVGLGTYIFNDGLSDIFLVYVGYVSFVAILFGVMFFVFAITTTFVRDPDNLSMAPPILKPLLKYFSFSAYTPINGGESIKVTYGSTNAPPEGGSAQPARDSPIRWACLVLYLVVTVPLIVTMIILAAAGAINT